jgi:DNA-binding response OmpR family regulator
MAPARPRPLVLLIEDNLTHLDLYSLILQDKVDVVSATRGETGLTIARVERPDAIIVDVLLPDADGLALCQQLREQHETSSIPLVVLTGDDDAYDRAADLRSVVDAILKKPCPADRLLATVHRAIVARAMR